MRKIPRRNFLMTLSACALGGSFLKEIQAEVKKKETVKPIEGSWFEFQHHSAAEGKYWNQTLEKFSSQQWDEKIKEIAETGIR